jgi:putative cell wall-binding protein
MLLTKPTSVPAATAAAMDDINPQRVVVIGGQSAVSDSVARQLAGMTTTGSMQRVAGANRYETAANLAAYYPTGLDVVYVATGSNYPDALAGSARAGSQGGPMLLTTRWSLPEETEAALQRLRPQRIVVVGGTDAVSDTVLALLRNYTS